MANYMTKQRKILLDFFSFHADEALSAKQIAEALADRQISVSSVYRNLSALEEAGLLKRISKSGSRDTYFQYTAAPECHGCLHLACKCCGKTYHMNQDAAELLIRSLEENDGFMIDRAETVLFGICDGCRNN